MGAYFQKCAICAEEFRAPVDVDLTVETNAYWQLKRHMEAHHAEAMFVCGRQGEGPRYSSAKAEAFWEVDGTCSFCGSLSSERFFEAVEAGAQVDPTDKSYKAYVHIPTEEPGRMRVVGSSNGDERPGDKWVPASEVDDETLRQSNWSRRGNGWLLLGEVGATHQAKFYFQHLDQAGQDRFIELYNAKRMNLGFPGHFYARPYFCEPAAPPKS